MRYVLALLLLFPSAALAADLDPAVLLELAKAKRLRESASVSPSFPKKTTCGCGLTGLCTCYVGECVCPACEKPSKKVSPGMKAIGARPADTSLQPGKELGSSGTNPEDSTSTPAPAAYQLGGTSGCASGNCPTSATTQRRGLIFRR